ncbi:hypothetical protein MKY91_05840 [Alkalicoccobacillus gibsonii]|uniref:Uncharacterized protein n=1 Tax=Alkalicoccobacillus gibsonii TaxID=79881 RepID=A0ABU9VFJ4_9BACI
MSKSSKDQTVFYSIKGSTIRNFIIIDCISGTGIYYVAKIVTTSIVIGIVSSVVGTVEMKKLSNRKRLKND